MSAIYITVRTYAGSDIYQPCFQAIQLAARLGIDVRFDLNGITITAHPNSDIATLVHQYHQAKHLEEKQHQEKGKAHR